MLLKCSCTKDAFYLLSLLCNSESSYTYNDNNDDDNDNDDDNIYMTYGI